METLEVLLYKTESKGFSTIIQGQMYHIQPSSAHLRTNVKCPTGTVARDIFCGKIKITTIKNINVSILTNLCVIFYVLVECTPGRYYKDGECVKCDFGTYQDQIGQSTCKECPEGTTTIGKDSRSVNECSVHLNKNSTGNYIRVVPK